MLLDFPEMGIEPALGQQLGMASLLGHPTLVQHNNAIRIHDGREAMGNDQCGLLMGNFTDRLENNLLGMAVQ